jgi:hypothetical protein
VNLITEITCFIKINSKQITKLKNFIERKYLDELDFGNDFFDTTPSENL